MALRRRFLLPSLLLGCLPWVASRASARPGEMSWVASNLPPFAWSGANGPQGYVCELIQLMSAKLGRSADVSFYPWVRAVRMTREGDDFGVFPLARTRERETQFRWLIPLVHMHYTFYVRVGSAANVDDAEALHRVQIGVLRGSAALGFLREHGYTNVVETQDYKDLVRHLSTGLVETIYGGTPMVNAAIEEFGYKLADFRTGLILEEADLYVATSLRVDGAEFERWQRAYRELQQDGSVARLLKKYPLVR